jgi:division protein CdvB (Snf7/Vps24/ESCRT-III family)
MENKKANYENIHISCIEPIDSHKTKLAYYLHRIKNMRKLTPEEIFEINTMEFVDRLKIMHAYNEMLECVQIFINDC